MGPVRRSRRRRKAWEEGRFEREVAPIEAPVSTGRQATGETMTVNRDQGLRDTTHRGRSRSSSRSSRATSTPPATSSQISDGAAAVLWMDEDKAKALGLKPAGAPAAPARHRVRPVLPARRSGGTPREKMLERSGMAMADFDLFEVNEAFAAVVLSWAQVHKPDSTA